MGGRRVEEILRPGKHAHIISGLKRERMPSGSIKNSGMIQG